MASEKEEWRPGSFTKNFSWGTNGLVRLYDAIRLGFDNQMSDVPRKLFRQRLEKFGPPDYIAMNFFLYNEIREGVDTIIADELVFQALNFRHNANFDKLAIFAFNLSLVGFWKGADPGQNRPALWAHHYIAERVQEKFNWDASLINAKDIEKFVGEDPRYKAKSAHKLSTNLAYIYRLGKMSDLSGKKIESWWINAVFLALDRILRDRRAQHQTVDETKLLSYLTASNFHALTGRRSIEKDLAIGHLIDLYSACGFEDRFSVDSVNERQSTLLPDIERYVANNPFPVGALHPSNPRLQKSIPRVCAMLARYAGFETFEIDDPETFNISKYVRENLQVALKKVRDKGIRPTMSAEELMKLMRGQ
jgi:hypothetical protein